MPLSVNGWQRRTIAVRWTEWRILIKDVTNPLLSFEVSENSVECTFCLFPRICMVARFAERFVVATTQWSWTISARENWFCRPKFLTWRHLPAATGESRSFWMNSLVPEWSHVISRDQARGQPQLFFGNGGVKQGIFWGGAKANSGELFALLCMRSVASYTLVPSGG